MKIWTFRIWVSEGEDAELEYELSDAEYELVEKYATDNIEFSSIDELEDLYDAVCNAAYEQEQPNFEAYDDDIDNYSWGVSFD